jgi:hypothetical protein
MRGVEGLGFVVPGSFGDLGKLNGSVSLSKEESK